MRPEKYVLQDTAGKRQNSPWHRLASLAAQLLIMCGVVGLLGCFFRADSIPLLLIAVAGAALAALELVGRNASWPRSLRSMPLVLALLLGLVQPLGFARAAFAFANQWITLWIQCFDRPLLKFEITEPSYFNRLQLFVLLTVFASYGVHRISEKKNTIAMGAVVLAVTLLVTVHGLTFSNAAMLCMLLGWLDAFAGNSGVTGRGVLVLATAAAVGLGAFGLQHMAVGGVASTLKTGILSAAERFRYGEDTLPQGDLIQAAQMAGDTTAPALTLTLQTPQRLYLKGFVGDTFDGAKWKELAYSGFSNDEMKLIFWLRAQGLEVSYQYARAGQYRDNTAFDAALPADESVTVQNVGADRRYLYAPYTAQALLSGSARENRDKQLKASGLRGASSYTFSMLADDPSAEVILPPELDLTQEDAVAFDQMERIYRTFVYDHYLTLTEAEQATADTLFFSQGNWTDASLYQITSQIRMVFQGATRYTARPIAYPGSADFLSWFMGQKSGNAAYYATAATLAFRAAGIPARYVEGYYLSATDALNAQATGESTVTLSKADTHAWTEVYVDSYGWLPVEVIPGFYYVQYTTQESGGTPQSSVNIKNQTAQEQLQGGSSDGIPYTPPQEPNALQDEMVERAVHLLGGVVLLLIVLWAVHIFARLQYEIRRRHIEKSLAQADPQIGCRMYYRHTCRMFRAAGLPLREEHPYDGIAPIHEMFPEIQEFEWKRYIALLQKVVFGEMELTEAEYLTVQSFDKKATEQVFGRLKLLRRLLVKYWSVLV